MEFEKKRIGVLGTGTWGIALSRLLANKGHDVIAWSAIESEIDYLEENRKHPNLKGMSIPDNLRFTKTLEEAIFSECIGSEIEESKEHILNRESDSNGKKLRDLILFAVPSVFIRSTSKQVAEIIKMHTDSLRELTCTSSDSGEVSLIAASCNKMPIMVTVAKGIEAETFMTMAQIIKDEFVKAFDEELAENLPVVALSGPTHAEEVAFDLPTAIVSACENEEYAMQVQDIFMTSNFRVYTNRDIHGVEICGAMKNVIALTVGISKGIGFGDNAKAALITRGMEEIKRLGIAMGCDEKTFSGLAGIGDLIVTATSEHSRNNRCGQLIGQGLSPDEAVKKVGMVVEGMNALPAVMALAKRYNVEVPLSEMLDDVVNKGINPKEAAVSLMSRERKAEF